MSYLIRVFDEKNSLSEYGNAIENEIELTNETIIEILGVSEREIKCVSTKNGYQIELNGTVIIKIFDPNNIAKTNLRLIVNDGVKSQPINCDCTSLGNIPRGTFARQGSANVTDRERECLFWLAQGLRTPRIAHLLDIREVTVNMHINNAKKKMRASTREEAVAKAVAYKIIKLSPCYDV